MSPKHKRHAWRESTAAFVAAVLRRLIDALIADHLI